MGIARKWIVITRPVLVVVWSFTLASIFVSADRSFLNNDYLNQINDESDEPNVLLKIKNFLWQSGQPGYHHVWPVSIPKFICAFVCVCVCFLCGFYIFITLSFLPRIDFYFFRIMYKIHECRLTQV